MTFKRLRTWFGLGMLTLIVAGTLWGIGIGTFCFLNLGIIRLICPVGFFELCLSNRKVYWDLVPPFLMVMGLVFLLGRSFCSWACPVALIFDGVDKVLNRILPARINGCRVVFAKFVSQKIPKLGAKDGMALLIGGLAGVAIFQYPFISTFCPIGVFTRNVISLGSHFRLQGDLLLLLVVAFMGYLFVNGWRDCCPVGMVYHIAAKKNRLFVPKVNKDKCTQCGICEKVCPFHLCVSKNNFDTSICSKCLSCIDKCPNQALHLGRLQSGQDGKAG